MLPDDARRALRKLNHHLADARLVVERWPSETPIWPLPEWLAALDDMMAEVVKYQGPDAHIDGLAAYTADGGNALPEDDPGD